MSARIAQIEALTEVLEHCLDTEVKTSARDLVRVILDLHRAGIATILDRLAAAGAPGQEIAADLARDSLVSGLLVLHDLHPEDFETRVRRALEEAGPRLRSQHRGNVELAAVVGDTVKLRLSGGCGTCPSSSSTLRKAVEDAILAAAPDVVAIEVESTVETHVMRVEDLVLLPVISQLQD